MKPPRWLRRLGASAVMGGQALAALADAGQRRLVVLGGAALVGSLAAEGLLDELQLSLCPLLLGGPHSWLPAALALPQPWRWQLREQRLLEGDELLLRYQRVGAESAPGTGSPAGLARDATAAASPSGSPLLSASISATEG